MEASAAAADTGARELHGGGIIAAIKASGVEYVLAVPDIVTSSGLLAPVSAILRDDENLPFVYVVQPDGSFARQHVALGYRTGDQYDIPKGLKAGDRVVDDGALFVQFLQNQ